MQPDHTRRGATFAAAIVTVVSIVPVASITREEVRINCFLLGSALPGICPLPNYFSQDPLFSYELDPQQAGLPLAERKRLDRLYFPRTKKILVEKFDMVFIYDPRLGHFTSKQFIDLYQAFTQEMMPSLWAFGPSYGDIAATMLNDVLPISDYDGYYHRPWHVVFRRDREPVFTPFIELGMEKVPGEAYGWMQPRPGTTIWADMKPYNFPWMVSWKPGPEWGHSWVLADEFNMVWWGLASTARGANPYGIDLMTNLVLYSLGRPLIQDVLLRRDARNRLSAYRSEKLTVLSMLEWADMFGANTLSLSKRVTDLDSSINDALDRYLEQDYPSVISLTEAASRTLGEIGTDAVRLKDQALFWVHISEWLTVTATSSLTAIAIWSLMIRRRMYKAVAATRAKLAH